MNCCITTLKGDDEPFLAMFGLVVCVGVVVHEDNVVLPDFMLKIIGEDLNGE